MNILNISILKNILTFNRIDGEKIQNGNTLTLAIAIEKYLRHLNASDFSANTIYFYSKDLDRMLNYSGNLLLEAITTEFLDDFLISIKNSESIKSPNSINRHKSVYRSFLKWCFLQEYLQKDFSFYIRLSKVCSKNTIAIRPDEIKKLLDTISKFNDPLSKRDRTLFAIYAFSGIRKAEALFLRVCDFDINSGIIYLPKLKSTAKRTQKIPTVLAKILCEYVNENFTLKNMNSIQPLFPGQKHNNPLSPRQASNRFEKWKKESGIRENLTIHSFRAGYATQIYRKHKDPLFVSYVLGHSSFSSTKRYINTDFFNINRMLESVF